MEATRSRILSFLLVVLDCICPEFSLPCRIVPGARLSFFYLYSSQIRMRYDSY
ncbi:hypothetical protein M758_9G042400 [Ceratodon purpureus]|uniref:Uncharacterized protein n=1 Tax=Ceratodon purpureus TaxID=3225 RepID=A0A8T0GS34_CERPU|nr:hypothetical protein KC19_9G041700 [Ceratodon purpureus]KAG0605236.1 hypothetical protein M758_9G042400 [Ceratodon purpureus]